MYLEIALRNLKKHKLRSVLALLGIVIGVMAISSLGILGGGLKQGIVKNFEDVSNIITLYPIGDGGNYKFDKKEIDKLRKLNCKVIPIYSRGELIELKKQHIKTYTTLYGIDKKDITYLNLKTTKKLTDTSLFAGNLFLDMNKVNVGDSVKINNKSFRIKDEYNGSFFAISGMGLIMTKKTYERFYKNDSYSYVMLKVNDKKDVEKIKNEVDKLMNSKEKKVSIVSMDMFLDAINNAMNMVSIFLMAIGGISLIVAGIGIGNVMLMSTIERTKEIGVMKAIGASKKDILILFIYEALILGVVGSLIGAIFSGVVGFIIITMFLKTTMTFESIIYLIIGSLFGIITSLISSIYPAYKASNLNPIESLRRD